jgi:hypothetical protein
MRGPFALTFLVLFLGCGAAYAQPQVLPAAQEAPIPQTKPAPVIEIKENTIIKASLKDENLGSILQNIGYQTGITVYVHPSMISKPVTTDFAGLPMDEAIRRILTLAGAANYRMIYKEDGKLAAVKVYQESREKAARRAAARPGMGMNTSPRGTDPPGRNIPRRFSRTRPVATPTQNATPQQNLGNEIPQELLEGAEEDMQQSEEPPEGIYPNP